MGICRLEVGSKPCYNTIEMELSANLGVSKTPGYFARDSSSIRRGGSYRCGGGSVGLR